MKKSLELELEEEAEEDTPLVSLLDTLSNGLGAAVLLGLVFAVARPQTPVPLGGPQAVLLRFTSQDHKALLAFRIKPAWTTEVLEPDLRGIKDGRIEEFKVKGRTVRFVAFGFTQDGASRVAASGRLEREYLLLVLKPEEGWEADGEWQLGIRYMSREGPLETWNERESFHLAAVLNGVIHVASLYSHQAVTPGDGQAREESVRLRLGGIKDLRAVKVGQQ